MRPIPFTFITLPRRSITFDLTVAFWPCSDKNDEEGEKGTTLRISEPIAAQALEVLLDVAAAGLERPKQPLAQKLITSEIHRVLGCIERLGGGCNDPSSRLNVLRERAQAQLACARGGRGGEGLR